MGILLSHGSRVRRKEDRGAGEMAQWVKSCKIMMFGYSTLNIKSQIWWHVSASLVLSVDVGTGGSGSSMPS